MPENQNDNLWVPEPPKPPTAKAELPAGVEKTSVNIDELKSNSVLVIKITTEGMQQRIAATQQIAMALRPLRDKIKEKNIAIIVMGVNESFDVLEEEQMNTLGWHKKEESRIILPR